MDEDVDALFAGAPEEFTAARNALVKRLRAEGRRDEAESVKALRRPTKAAWAINQVARRDPEAVDGLLAAGEGLAAAQRRALSGVKESGLRAAAQARREQVEAVWRLVATVLAEAGVDPASHRQAVADTLEAASVDNEAAQLVRAGRLTAELPAPSGFGAVAGLAVVDAGSGEPAAADAATEDQTDVAAKRELAAAQEEARRAEAHADELQERAGDARQRALRTRSEVERLQQQAAAVGRKADEAEAEADDLAARAQQAREEADGARERLQRAEHQTGASGRS